MRKVNPLETLPQAQPNIVEAKLKRYLDIHKKFKKAEQDLAVLKAELREIQPGLYGEYVLSFKDVPVAAYEVKARVDRRIQVSKV